MPETILVTGSAGHLGEALMRTYRGQGALAPRVQGHHARGIDIRRSIFADVSGNIADRAFVREVMRGCTAVLHTATLHKPHVGTHSKQAFIDTNITATLNLLEEAAAAGVRTFVFTSTTSAFGRALAPPPGAPAAWITEAVPPLPKNIYGVTKVAAEDLCELVQRASGMSVLILRAARFFPEDDDDPTARAAMIGENLRANEFLHRRVDLEDVVDAHLSALDAAKRLRFGRYIVSATTPFEPEDLPRLRTGAAAVVRERVPGCEALYQQLGWALPASIDRVYVNGAARRDLGWAARTDFSALLRRVATTGDARSELARAVGIKGYHPDRREIYPFA